MNQQKWLQAAGDLNLCLLVSQVNCVILPALSLLVFGSVSFHLFCLCNNTPKLSSTLATDIKLVQGLPSPHSEMRPGPGQRFLLFCGHAADWVQNKNSWGWVSVSPVTQHSHPNPSDVWLLHKERMMGGECLLEKCLLEKFPSKQPHCGRPQIYSDVPLGFHH